MGQGKEYYAFISYSQVDDEWAVWLHYELEHYHLPKEIMDVHPDLPKFFGPVFKDIDELKAGNLSEQIHNALCSSKYLIVICSPSAAVSEWVDKEITDFIEIGKSKGINNTRNVFPFIVAGHPYAKNKNEECFPKSILDLSKEQQRIGANISDIKRYKDENVNWDGRDKAFVKLIAGMLPNISFDDLWKRYEREKIEKERLEREEKERFMRMQSRFVSEKINELTSSSSLAQCLALEVLPQKMESPNRPFTFEAERALRKSALKNIETLMGHTHSVNSLSFSSDGKRIASIADDFTIRIWDSETGTLIRIIKTDHSFGRCVTFSPDDTMLFAVFGDGTLTICDINDDEMMELDFNKIFNTERPAVCVSSMAINPEGVVLAIGTSEGDIFLLNLETKETASIEVEPILSVAFSPDGKSLVSTTDESLCIWDLEKGSCGSISLKEGLEPQNANATFSPDGDKVAFIFDNIVGVIDVKINGRAEEFGYDDSKYVSVAFCDNGKHILTVSELGEIKIWDVEKQQAIYVDRNVLRNVNYVTFDAKGLRAGLVVDGKTIVVQDVKPEWITKISVCSKGLIGSIAYSPDGKCLVLGSVECEKADLVVEDVYTGRVLKVLSGHTDRVRSVFYSLDGEKIVSSSYDGTVRVWDIEKGECIKTLTIAFVVKESTAATYAVFSPDGQKVAVATYNGYVLVWSINSNRILHKLKHSSNPVWSISFSPDGKSLASSSLDRDIKIWDMETGCLTNVLKGHTDSVNSVDFSPEGKCLLSAGSDRTAIIWDLATGKILKKMGMTASGNTPFPATVKTKKQDNTLQLINHAETLGLMGQQTKGMPSAFYSSDGKYIVSTLFFDTLTIWASETGQEVLSLSGYTDSVNCVRFSPKGNQIASVSADGVMIVWSFPSLQELIDHTQERVKYRPLTSNERRTYYLE